MLTVSSSPCGRATSGSGAPVPVVAIPGDGMAVMVVVLSAEVRTDFWI